MRCSRALRQCTCGRKWAGTEAGAAGSSRLIPSKPPQPRCGLLRRPGRASTLARCSVHHRTTCCGIRRNWKIRPARRRLDRSRIVAEWRSRHRSRSCVTTGRREPASSRRTQANKRAGQMPISQTRRRNRDVLFALRIGEAAWRPTRRTIPYMEVHYRKSVTGRHRRAPGFGPVHRTTLSPIAGAARSRRCGFGQHRCCHTSGRSFPYPKDGMSTSPDKSGTAKAGCGSDRPFGRHPRLPTCSPAAKTPPFVPRPAPPICSETA